MTKKKSQKWMKLLNSRLIDSILMFDPVKVDFEVQENEHVICTIELPNGNLGIGISICSMDDVFDIKEGKEKAAGRALAAIKKQKSSRYIRSLWSEFPNTWLKEEIIRLINYADAFEYKSAYLVCGN